LRRGSYISDDFQQREDDIAWKIKVGGDWDCLYLLIEFQLRVDKHMALRMILKTAVEHIPANKNQHNLDKEN